MIGICLLIASTNIHKDVEYYFDQAINAYYNRSKLPFYATRATILYYELLKSRNLYKDAPTALIRLTGDVSFCNSQTI